MRLLPAQRELMDSTDPTVLLVGGYGSGKTKASAYKALQLVLENPPNVPGCYIEPTYTMIRDVAVRLFQETYQELNIPTWYKANDHVMNVAEHSDILFRSGDNPNLLVGLNLAWAGIDEPARQPEDIAKVIKSRIRHPKATRRQLFMTGTPEGFNWFYDWTLGERTRVIRARTSDNPFLPEDYVQELSSRLSPEEIRAYIEGEFVSFEGAWFRTKPRVTDHTDIEFGVKQFKPLGDTSGQLILAVDTGGGLGRDGSALALIDKRDRCLVASWKSSSALIHELVDVIVFLTRIYTAGEKSKMPAFLPDGQVIKPHVRIEKNGIGQATYQECLRRGIACSTVSTTEASRYQGLEAARRAVHAGELYGPEEMAEEARLLTVKDNKFVGPKDLVMAAGIAYNYLALSPYQRPMDPASLEVLNLQKRLMQRSGHWR